MDIGKFRRRRLPFPFRSPRPSYAYRLDEVAHARGTRAGDVPARGRNSHEKATAKTGYIWRAACIWVVCAALAATTLITAWEAQSASPELFFLVATPDMPDSLFQKSVILMLPPMRIPLVAGLIINKPTTMLVRALFPHASGLKRQTEPAYFGGPVDLTEPSLVLRTSEPSGKATRLFDDIYVTTDPRPIAELLKDPRPAKDLRLFLGRSQWTGNQLHAEILERSWYVVPVDAGLVFSPDPARVWRVLVERAQLQKVNATRAPEPKALAVLCCAGGSPAWP